MDGFAWSAANGISFLGQVKVGHDKSNEITAIPLLIEFFWKLSGCIVTI